MSHSAGRQLFHARESFAGSFSNYDVIDPRIDVSAQKALIRMRASPATSREAASMLASVKGGRLRGIYGDDLRAAAQLAARRCTARWELVPRGRVAVVVRERSPLAPPTIIFRAQYRGDAARLDPALAAAWRGYLDGLYAAALGEGESESFIVGGDDRVLVRDTLAIPFRFVCCLEFTFRNPTNGEESFWRGSGTLVSDSHVLTAAHNVLRDASRDDLAFPVNYVTPDRMLVVPARDDRNFPYDSSEVVSSKARVSPQWKANADRQRALGNTTHMPGPAQFDYALLTLSSPLGASAPAVTPMQLPAPLLGHWGHPKLGGGTRIRAYDADAWRRLRDAKAGLNLSGYPADKCRAWPASRSATEAELSARRCRTEIPGMEPFVDWGSTQWRSYGRLINPFEAPGLVTYDCDTAFGNSGGPVWLTYEGYRNLVAIHTKGLVPNTSNAGVPITAPLLAQLRRWMADDKVSPTF